jgi:hypothetical protein
MEGGKETPKTAERKPSTYRGVGVGTKEKVSSGSYKAPTKKKAEPVSDPWEGSYKKSSEVKTTKTKTKAPTKPKAKAPARKKKSNKLDALLSDIRSEETSIERLDRISREKVAQRAAAAKAEKEKRTTDASKFASFKQKYISGGGTPVGALDAWQKRKMAKEEVQIDEKTLTKMEMKKREEIVKSMKDKASDFEKRYPGRGKEVMYATATKMAKRMAEQATELQPASQMKPKEKPLDTAAERQKYSNLKMMQMKQQQLQKQRLNLQKQGKLPLESN